MLPKQIKLPNLLSSPFFMANILFLRHCEADDVSRSNLVRGMRLPRTFQVLAMTKREVSDKLGDYRDVEKWSALEM